MVFPSPDSFADFKAGRPLLSTNWITSGSTFYHSKVKTQYMSTIYRLLLWQISQCVFSSLGSVHIQNSKSCFFSGSCYSDCSQIASCQMVLLVAQCSGLIEEFLGIASNRISVDLVSGKQPLLVWVQVKAESRGRTPRKSILIETAKPSKAKASETSYCEPAFSGQHCDLPPFKTT